MNFEPTKRAYTMRLAPRSKDASDWSSDLWRTHETVNLGAAIFADWFLTCRGGLSHELGTTDDAKVLLALSWLSVEAPASAVPKEWIVPHQVDPRTGLILWDCVSALEGILKTRGFKAAEIEKWVAAARPALEARIREDSVWVNRSIAFEKKGSSIPDQDLWTGYLTVAFGSKISAYLKLPDLSKEAKKEKEEEGSDSGGQQVRGWLSKHFGSGKKTNAEKVIETLDALRGAVETLSEDLPGEAFTGHLLRSLNSSGLPALLTSVSPKGNSNKVKVYLKKLSESETVGSDEKLELLDRVREQRAKSGKSAPPATVAKAIRQELDQVLKLNYRGGRIGETKEIDRIDFFCVLLAHAQRRISGAHSWIKRAEATRRALEADRRLPVDPAIRSWLDAYCERQGALSGSLDQFRITRAALSDHEEVFKKWSRKSVKTEAQRIEILNEIQDESDKFGDARFFRALAAEDAVHVWKDDKGKQLLHFVRAREAEEKIRHYKVPSYRHPDPLRNPVFSEFGNSKAEISFAAQGMRTKEVGLSQLQDLTLELIRPDGEGNPALVLAPLRWRSKRLREEIIGSPSSDPSVQVKTVSRITHLGQQASSALGEESVVSRVFDAKHWNGRLQAPRRQLDELAAYVDKNGWDEKALRLRSNLKWGITFSPDLSCIGPWIDLAKERNFKKYRAATFGPHEDKDRERKLLFCRIPGLRLLGVDFGQRFGAACTIWETCTSEEVKRACDSAGLKAPDQSSVLVEIPKSSDGKSKTVYRRIANDFLSPKSPHPAPWARLEAQFTIKLEGENGESRKASPEELQNVRNWLHILNVSHGGSLPTQRDELADEAVGHIRRGIRRHSDSARIAYALIAKEEVRPGGVRIPLTSEKRAGYLARAVKTWANLCQFDSEAKKRWDDWISPLVPGIGPEGISKEDIQKVGEALAKRGDLMPIHQDWRRSWEKRDPEIQKKVLRPLRDWIFPRGMTSGSRSVTRTGGLSLRRVLTMTECRRAMMSFHMRPKPHDLNAGVPERGDSRGSGFGQSMLDDIEQLRENRVKQLVSRILLAALGGPEGKRKPCHLISVEYLKHYKPDEERSRRENAGLMQWSVHRVEKLLAEGAELHGLALTHVSPSYTSRYCSRTNLPGLRCVDVPVETFVAKEGRWRKAHDKAIESGSTRAHDLLLIDLFKHWNEDSREWTIPGSKQKHTLSREGVWTPSRPRPIRLTQQGGDLFQSLSGRGAIQADFNASANIGLQAVLDPDWIGSWWRVPCVSSTGEPDKRTKGSAAFKAKKPLLPPNESAKKEFENAWRWPGLTAEDDIWTNFSVHWNKVAFEVVRVLREVNWRKLTVKEALPKVEG
jgi:hypothetical protein